jgi:two-component system chemotaxis response regulator CheY
MPDRSELKILVVDDYRFMRSLIIRMLEGMGFRQFLEAEDGEMALDLLEGGSVDLVLSDYQMPNMDGLEMLRALRQDEAYASLPVIILTADKTPAVGREVLNSGAQAFLGKPFTADKLEEILLPILG